MPLTQFIHYVRKRCVVSTIWNGYSIECTVKGFTFTDIPNSRRRRYSAVLEKPDGSMTNLLLCEIKSIRKL